VRPCLHVPTLSCLCRGGSICRNALARRRKVHEAQGHPGTVDGCAPCVQAVRAIRPGATPASGESVTYLGFEVNGKECEEALGGSFETHIPSRNQIVYRVDGREVVANVGDSVPVSHRGEEGAS
jgi:hypothetical protein